MHIIGILNNMNKNEARKYSLDIRKNKDSITASATVVDALISSNILNSYQHIGIYYPIGKEINIMELVNKYPNKEFYLPVTNEELVFKKYKLGDELLKGPFNTHEPIGQIVDRDIIECFIIPCVAISKNNQRIGYGKGYYDRYLMNYNGLKIGVCYKESGELAVDCDSFDVVLDYKIVG